MPLLTLNLSCENVKYPARKHFEQTNNTKCKEIKYFLIGEKLKEYDLKVLLKRQGKVLLLK